MKRYQYAVLLLAISLALGAEAACAGDLNELNPRATHAFAVSKQRFTLGMPEGSRKTLVDLWEPGLVLRWSTQKLLDVDCFKRPSGLRCQIAPQGQEPVLRCGRAVHR